MPRKPAATRPITMQPDTPNVTYGELCAEVIRFKRLRNLAPDTISFYEDCGRYDNKPNLCPSFFRHMERNTDGVLLVL